MNKTIRRWGAALLTAILLAGCGAQAENPAPETEKNQQQTAVTATENNQQQTAPVTAQELGLEDGVYMAEVTLTGGSGRAGISSPARLTVADGRMTAEIVWSSQNYDYMLVGDEKYEPVTLEPGSTFVIPAEGFDSELSVIADTTAMSEPHEISYTLNFDSETVTEE